MSPTRRDLIKFSTAGAFLASLPATSVAAAMRSLEVPVSPMQSLDPGRFAQDVHNVMATYNDLWYSSIAPEEWAEYRQAMEAVQKAIPAWSNPDHFDVTSDLDAAITSLVCQSHHIGLRHGARFEHLRRGLVSDTAQCPTCWGSSTDASGKCPMCGGSGVVPFAEGGE